MKKAMKHAKTLVMLIISMSMAVPVTWTADQDVARKRMQELSTEIARHDHLYYVLGKPEISDKAYDRLFDELLRLEKAFPDLVLRDSPTQRVGAELDNTFPRVRHIIPMLSLDKCYSPQAIVSWARKAEEKAGRKLSFVAEEKIDGTAIELTYEHGILTRAATRGNGETGYDITNNARTIRSIPLRLKQPVSITVRGEVFVSKADFDSFRGQKGLSHGSARNLAAGALRRKQSSETAIIALDSFMFEAVAGDVGKDLTHAEVLALLGDLGFRINPHNQTFHDPDQLGSYLNAAASQRDTRAYEIDGMVIKVNERDVRLLLGATERYPRWAMAYKFEAPENVTVVEQIDVQIGRHGRITPVAKLRPVIIKGAVITRGTLHNQDYVDMLELGIGDTVKVSRRGDVIPSVDHVLENSAGSTTWQIPAHCPGCGTRLVIRGMHHFCPNWECPDRVRARLIHFSKTMRIRHLGPKTIERLMSQKRIQRPEDIYALEPGDMAGMKGFGEKKITTLISSIRQSKTRPFQAILTALGIEGLGPRYAKFLSKAGFDSVDKILKAGVSGLSQVKGIGKVTAQKIVHGFTPRLMLTIEALKKEGLSL